MAKCPTKCKSQISQGNTFLKKFWQSSVDDRFDLDNAIQTKAEFSHAIAVMDKLEGWEEENWVGSRLAASMWILWGDGKKKTRFWLEKEEESS